MTKIPADEILHEVIIRALQMVLNAWKRYLESKRQERLEREKNRPESL